MRRTLFTTAVLFVVVAMFFGCSSPFEDAIQTGYLYSLVSPVGYSGPNTINGYAEYDFGGLAPLSGSPYATGGDVDQMDSKSGLVASPDGE